MFLDEARRRHGVTCVTLLISLIFAIVAIATTEWVIVETGPLLGYQEFSFKLCCYGSSDVPSSLWFYTFNSVVMFIAIGIQGIYLLYLLLSLGRGHCPAHMVRTDLSVSSFLVFLYLIVVICWPWAAIDYYDSFFYDVWPGYSYYLACVACVFAISAAGASSYFLRSHGGWYY